MIKKIPFRISWMNRDLKFLTYILFRWLVQNDNVAKVLCEGQTEAMTLPQLGRLAHTGPWQVMPSCHANHVQDTKSLRRWQALDHQKTNPARNSADTLHLRTCNMRYTDEHGVMALGCTTKVTFWHGRIGTLKPTPCRPASIPAAFVVKPASVAQLKTALLEARQAQLPPINHLASLRSWGGPRAYANAYLRDPRFLGQWWHNLRAPKSAVKLHIVYSQKANKWSLSPCCGALVSRDVSDEQFIHFHTWMLARQK